MLFTIILGACYQYDIEEEQYEASEGFLWKWNTDRSISYIDGSDKKKYDYENYDPEKSKWEKLGFMGHNFLYNDDGIVFSVPLALSQRSDSGSESGTIILKTETGKRFLQF